MPRKKNTTVPEMQEPSGFAADSMNAPTEIEAMMQQNRARRAELDAMMQQTAQDEQEQALHGTMPESYTGDDKRLDGARIDGRQEQGTPEGRPTDNPATYQNNQRSVQNMTDADVTDAMKRAEDYRRELQPFYDRLVENEEYYRQRYMMHEKEDQQQTLPQQASAYLLNSIINKTADVMDNFPEANILPREESDTETANLYGKIIPVVQQRNHFKHTYYHNAIEKVKSGVSVFGIFWDASAENGLGEVTIESIDPLDIRWEPGVKNIQDSKEIFILKDYDSEVLEALYPEMKGRTGFMGDDRTQYLGREENIDRTNKTTVYDWYYKKTVRVEIGGEVFPRTVLHYAKFAGGKLLFASENDPRYQNGWYQDGKYPFVFDVLYPVKNTCYGFGFIDMMRQPQRFIDKLDYAILKNATANATPRYFVKEQMGIDEKEFSDFTKFLVHYSGGDPSGIVPMTQNPLPAIYESILNDKKEELKENTGNRDFSQGTTSGGVTAASAIAALQEASSKTSRTINIMSYAAYEEVIAMMISRMQQFYTVPRTFRVVSENGTMFEEASPEALTPGAQFDQTLGQYTGGRIPIYDITISAQKQSPYSKIATNELAKELFQLGVFNPELADQAVPMVKMMDFDKKEEVLETIIKNQQMQQQIMQMQQLLAGLGPMITQLTGNASIEQMFTPQEQAGAPLPDANVRTADSDTSQLGDTTVYKDNSKATQETKRARQAASVGGGES